MIPFALLARNDGRQARGLRFLHSTANRAYAHKNLVRTPDFKRPLRCCQRCEESSN